MNWLNLKTSQLREPEFIGSDPTARATWLCLLAYCVEMENGGRIRGARLWKDRQWQQTCGVMLAEVEVAPLLLKWKGNDLIIWAYPADKQSEVQTKRQNAVQNGKRGGRPKTEKNNQEKTNVGSENNQHCKAEGEGEGEGKGKEKGKEGELLFCAESAEPTSAPPKEPVLIFPCDGPAKEWKLTEEKLAEWQEAYPAMDVLACVREAKLWAANNPARRKTANGMTRFLGGWLSRAQNKGEHRRTVANANASPSYWTPTDPDAFRPQGDALAEAFRAHHGDNPLAAGILEKLNHAGK